MRIALEVLTLLAGALAIVLVLPRTPHRGRAERRHERELRPQDLERIERLVFTGTETASAVHARLRPLLREIAQGRLQRRGVQLDRSPARARELLGAELWELVRPDRRRPQDPRAPGMSLRELAEIVDRLEQL